jgi:hypothetical protein
MRPWLNKNASQMSIFDNPQTEVTVGRPLFFTNEERLLIERHLTEAAYAARSGRGAWRKTVIEGVEFVNQVIRTAIRRSHEPPPDSRAERVDPFEQTELL